MHIEVVLSVVAIAMSAASLTWQVVSWRRTGAVVKAETTQALIPWGDCGADRCTCVTARNSGRAPATVVAWGLRFPDGGSLVMPQNLPYSTPLPHRLEAGAQGTWFIPTDGVRAECAQRGVPYQELTGYVRLGDGRTITARRRGIGLQ